MTTPHTTGSMLTEYGTEQYLPANALAVDPTYQRPTNAGRVKKIADSFDAELAGRLVVNLRKNGQYHVVDGQHRLAAMRMRKIPLVPCIVYEGWTPEREAEVFRLLNTLTKQPTHYERHRAGVRAGHKDSLDIEEIVAAVGCRLIERSHSGGSGKKIAAVLMCYRIYHSRFGGPDLLRRTLSVLSDSFGDQDHAFDGDMVVGVAFFLWRASREGQFDEDHLRQTLQATTPSELMRAASDWLRVTKYKYGAIAYVIRERYNKGKRSKRLDVWTNVEWGEAMSPNKAKSVHRFANSN